MLEQGQPGLMRLICYESCPKCVVVVDDNDVDDDDNDNDNDDDDDDNNDYDTVVAGVALAVVIVVPDTVVPTYPHIIRLNLFFLSFQK